MIRTRIGVTILVFCLSSMALGLLDEARGQEVPTAPTLFPTRSDPLDLPVLLGGVPRGEVQAEPVELGLVDAVHRALEQNLAMLLEEEQVRLADSVRRDRLSELLPELSLGISQARRQINLAATGFGGLPGFPDVIGPFDVFDARLYLSSALFDASALADARGGRLRLQAAEHERARTRALVVLASGSLYLRTLAAASRVEAIAAQVRTSEQLHRLADDRHQAGVVPGIDVLRAEVRLESDRQRLIAAQNLLATARLRLARAIGLPPGQDFRLTDVMHFVPRRPLTLDEAIDRALGARPDLQSQRARVEAAAAERRAASRERLPSLELVADVGEIGGDVSDTGPSFQVVAGLRLPLFQAGRIGAAVLRADAAEGRARAELADLEAAVEYQVRAAFLDLEAAEALVEAARRRNSLAEAQLTQAQNRFAAGVSDNLEVVQAQEAVAAASEVFISSLLAHSLAKGALARALGTSEETLLRILAGNETENDDLDQRGDPSAEPEIGPVADRGGPPAGAGAADEPEGGRR